MFNPKNFWLMVQSLVLGFLTLFGVAACVDQPEVPKPPIEIPFSLDKGGESLELQIRIPEKQTYTFGLGFLVDKSRPNDAENLLKLLGNSSKNPQNRYANLGIPLKIRIQAHSSGKDTAFFTFDKVESEIGIYSGGFGSYNKKISNLRLEPGIYKVKIDNLQAVPEFAGRTLNFHIYRAYLGK